MNNGMNRRDFLKYSIATGVLLAAGEGMMERVMADETMKVAEVDRRLSGCWRITAIPTLPRGRTRSVTA
jgi:hypothetical protein